MDDLKLVCKGKRYHVYMTAQVSKQFDKADAKERARCKKWMDFFADDGPEFLDEQKLKHEGKFSTGARDGSKVAIWAFKAWQLRVYGGFAQPGIFVATEVDISKKQNVANQSLLAAAARKLLEYMK